MHELSKSQGSVDESVSVFLAAAAAAAEPLTGYDDVNEDEEEDAVGTFEAVDFAPAAVFNGQKAYRRSWSNGLQIPSSMKHAS